MVPTFICLALGLWLDKKLGTCFTIPLLILGIAAGCRNAYVLAMNSIKQDEVKKKLEHFDVCKGHNQNTGKGYTAEGRTI